MNYCSKKERVPGNTSRLASKLRRPITTIYSKFAVHSKVSSISRSTNPLFRVVFLAFILYFP